MRESAGGRDRKKEERRHWMDGMGWIVQKKNERENGET